MQRRATGSKKKSYNSNAQADPLGTAITDASAGATLRVIGTCRGNFVIDKSLTLRGRDSETQIDALDGNGGGRVLTVLSGPSGGDPVRVEVSRLAIGNGETGIVTHDRSALTIDDSAVRDNTGAGISAPCPGCASGQLTLNHSNISENGAGIAATPPRVLALNSSTVSHNEGAGIFTTGLSMVNGAVMVLNSSTVHSNGGSGITFGRIGSLTLTDSSVSDNGATGIATTGSPITGANATISGNMGGGISTSFGRLTLTDSMVSGNVTTGNGGGIAGPFITGQQAPS